MEVVYIDSLFLLNALMDYLLLLASARMAGERLYRLRMLTAGVLGGGYAVASVFPGCAFLLHPICKLGGAVLMVLIGLGRSRRLLRQTMIFLFLSCALGGGVLAISLFGGAGEVARHGILRTDMDLKVVLLSAGICYAFITLVAGRTAKHSGAHGEMVRLSLEICDRRTSFIAILDTGNTLADPADGRPVMVVDWDRMCDLVPGFIRRYAEEPTYGLEQLNRGDLQGRFRLIPYRAVGVECGMLLAVRANRALLNGRIIERPLVAISPTEVSDGGGYCGLVGGSV